jgi:DNA-directed RNA polymerase specialized sigma24 family protein
VGLREGFPKTSWTLLAQAREPGGFQARDDFARMYYAPALAFLRVKLRDDDLAQELAQEFFGRLSATGGIFEHADREHGAFRTYLMRSLQNFVIDYHRGQGRLGPQDTHPDQWNEGGWDVLSPKDNSPAEGSFHRAWVAATLSEALERVREICARKTQSEHLALFEARYLCDSDTVPSWEEVGARYGMDQKTARTRAETVARHFRLVLRRMLRQQVAVERSGQRAGSGLAETAVDKEIEALLRFGS